MDEGQGGGALRVVVTRPAAQAGGWVERLRPAGIDAVALPLIEIAPAADPDALRAAWDSLPTRRLAVFVSPNAVLHFFAARAAHEAWPNALLAAAPGPGTADALRTAGVDASRIVAPAADADQLDSEALWQQLAGHDWRGAGVLVVRGDGGREWLAERLAEAGAHVDTVAAYRRAPPVWTPDARQRLDALLAADQVAATVWLFTSSQAIAHLEGAAGPGRFAPARAIATHPRIAARARAAGFGRVVEASPGFDALVACIQSLQP